MRLLTRRNPRSVGFTSIGLGTTSASSRPGNLERVYPRLIAASSIPKGQTGSLRYATPWGDQALEAFVQMTPEGAVVLTDGDLARLGAAELRTAAIANLRRDPVEDRIVTDPGDGGTIHTVFGTTSHTASRACILEDELDLVGKHPDGALVAIPNPNNLLFHVLTDRYATTGFRSLALAARVAFKNGSPPISPQVYWWRKGKVTQVTRTDGRHLRPDIPSELAVVFDRLAAKK
ncbi:MAG: hypothetical protein JW722_08895 [Demequinaceae bacterium]|nr:hypothetical protein [Demequinaceae bacterium]